MVSLKLLYSQDASTYYTIYTFLNPRFNLSKSNGITKMPIPATGDPPMLMNLEGMSEDLSIRFTIVERDDNCGIDVPDNYQFPDGSYIYYSNGKAYFSSGGLDYELNTILGQIYFLTNWGVTGEVANYYKLRIDDENGNVWDIEGIGTNIRFNWNAGEMKVDADLKFVVGTVVV